MRINKFLSEAGIVSRRGADKWISDGRITINGTKAELGRSGGHVDYVAMNGNQLQIHLIEEIVLKKAALLVKGKLFGLVTMT